MYNIFKPHIIYLSIEGVYVVRRFRWYGWEYLDKEYTWFISSPILITSCQYKTTEEVEDHYSRYKNFYENQRQIFVKKL